MMTLIMVIAYIHLIASVSAFMMVNHQDNIRYQHQHHHHDLYCTVEASDGVAYRQGWGGRTTSHCASGVVGYPMRMQPFGNQKTKATTNIVGPRFAFLAFSDGELSEPISGSDPTTTTTSTTIAAAAVPPPRSPPPPPMFNGKSLLPGSIVLAGLKATTSSSTSTSTTTRVPAVYAIYSSAGAKSSDGGTKNDWTTTMHVGTTQDLYSTLLTWESKVGKISRIRALSFSSTLAPQPLAMQEIVQQWKQQALDAGATLMEWIDPSPYVDDYDEDDDNDDYDVEMRAQSMAVTEGVIVSPFAGTAAEAAAPTTATDNKDIDAINADLPLPFTVESVDRVLDEVRPYLVADGGNVAVVSVLVEEDTVNRGNSKKTVQLMLEGACGSCPSSTVTMKMGIERVLKEQYGPNLVVEQVLEDNNSNGSGENSSSYYRSLVEDELKRLSPAVTAMGGTTRIVQVNEDTGEVQLFFRGPSKLKQGLELALRDVIPSVVLLLEEEASA